MSAVYKVKAEAAKDLGNVKIFDFDLPTWNLGLAMAELDGRFPPEGKSSNVGCELIFYVLSGSGTIYSENGVFDLETGDVYHFKKSEKYYVVGKRLKVLMPSSPAWQAKDFKLFPDSN